MEPNTKHRILVVDDCEEYREVVSLYLEDASVELVEAESGLEALKMAKESSFCLALMDLSMPGLDGYQATRLIRENEKSAGRKPFPIIAFTSQTFHSEYKKNLDAKFDHYITKPIRKEEFLSTIMTFL